MIHRDNINKPWNNLLYNSGTIEPGTNQRGELYAIFDCIQSNVKIDYLISDSKYSINCLTSWYKNCIKNNWKTSKNEDVLNKDIIEPIINNNKLKNIKFIHINSHSGNYYNDQVDKLAKQAVQ